VPPQAPSNNRQALELIAPIAAREPYRRISPEELNMSFRCFGLGEWNFSPGNAAFSKFFRSPIFSHRALVAA